LYDTAIQLAGDELEAVRQDREAEQWLAEEMTLEGLTPVGPPSGHQISDTAFNLIVEFEVSSQQVYIAKYQKPTWPGGASGVTIGIGYDVGYTTSAELHADFDTLIPAGMVTALEKAIGVTGAAAALLAQNLAASVVVPWDAAIGVHRSKVIPRWAGLTERSLPNTGGLDGDAFGALVSLTYNRGASFSAAGDRFAEMRAIKADMTAEALNDIPAQFRSMKRLWPTVPGLQKRREREAQLFEAGTAGA
jgi:GH24 family phage-related lysozyme (muramidase)